MSKIITPATTPDPEGIGPWLSKYDPPSRPMIVTIDKAQAGDWLDYRVPDYRTTGNQRNRSAKVVAKYTGEMNAGRWRLTPQGLIVTVDGWLVDGQHRLQALRNSDLSSLDFWVFPDEPIDLFAHIDVHYTRQARQLYQGPNATTVTAAVRYLGDTPGKYIGTMTPAAQLEAVSRWPEVVTHAAGVMSTYLRVRIPAAPHLAVMAQAERSIHRDKIPAWLAGLSYGAGLDAGDARLHLRDRFRAHTGRQRSTDLVYNTIAKAWSHYVEGKAVQVLSWRAGDGIIEVPGVGDPKE